MYTDIHNSFVHYGNEWKQPKYLPVAELINSSTYMP